MEQDSIIKDSIPQGWVERMPEGIRPFLRLSRYDRPIGFWLLALPGWIGLVFAALSASIGFAQSDLKYAALIGIGAIAMRGAGCTYNDIVDRDLDKQVERTALRPLAAGTISVKSAWVWLALQCLVGLIVLMFFPRLSQIIAVSSIALVAAYPFMKRITYWPQAWLGMTFNWAVLVAYTAKTGQITPALLLLYAGLIFWTIGYDTIYACQDVEDDAMIGVKSTARLFGNKVKIGVGMNYFITVALLICAFVFHKPEMTDILSTLDSGQASFGGDYFIVTNPSIIFLSLFPFTIHLSWQIFKLNQHNSYICLRLFKSNQWAALIFIISMSLTHLL